MTMTSLDPDGNIFSAFASAAAKNANKTAIIYLGTRFTYKSILRRVENFAASLKDAGVAEGERIVLYVPNSVHWVIAWLGIQRAGAVVVPITPIYTKHDLIYIANDSGAKHIVCSDNQFRLRETGHSRDRPQKGDCRQTDGSVALVEKTFRLGL